MRVGVFVSAGVLFGACLSQDLSYSQTVPEPQTSVVFGPQEPVGFSLNYEMKYQPRQEGDDEPWAYQGSWVGKKSPSLLEMQEAEWGDGNTRWFLKGDLSGDVWAQVGFRRSFESLFGKD